MVIKGAAVGLGIASEQSGRRKLPHVGSDAVGDLVERPRVSQRAFDVLGCDTGTRYRITCGTAMNVHQLDRTGRRVAKWCFVPEGDVVTGDILLAQKIALETMDSQVFKLANTQVSR
jgi:hypothetical protein